MRARRSLPAEWIVCAYSTCFGVRCPSSLSGQEVGQDQQRVERRAQLVRHVGEELRLVPRGDRELVGLLLETGACQLDLAVLDLDVAVLLGEERRLLLELLVGLAQLDRLVSAAPRSSDFDCSSSSSVRLVRHDARERYADRLHLAGRGTAGAARRTAYSEPSSITPIHLVLEQHEHHDRCSSSGAPPRPDATFTSGRHVGSAGAPALQGRLAHEPLSHREAIGHAAAALVAVARDQPQLWSRCPRPPARKNAPCWAETVGVSSDMIS